MVDRPKSILETRRLSAEARSELDRILVSLGERYGYDYMRLRDEMAKGNTSVLDEVPDGALENAFADKWVMENAAIRNLTVMEFLHMLVESRINRPQD